MSQYVTKVRTNQGDLQVDYNALANLPDLSQGGSGSNPNIFANGEFWFWQRGTRFTNIERCYTADRWYIGNALNKTALVEQSQDVPEDQIMDYSIHIKENVEENTYLTYYFDRALKGTFTLSFWYKTSAPFNVWFKDNTEQKHIGKLEVLDEWTKAVFTFSAKHMVRLDLIHAMSIGDTYITGAKLEYGEAATAFIPRPHADELALCQRFFCRIRSLWPSFITRQQLSGKDYAYIAIPLVTSLYRLPDLTYTNVKLAKNDPEATSVKVTDIEAIAWSKIGVTLKLFTADNFDTSATYFLIMPEDGYIDFDSEIYPAS